MNQLTRQRPCPALVAWPPQAAFGRSVPKIKFYEQGQVNARLKALFVKQVEQIVWQYKLAPETINLPATRGVQEIQVFSVHLKTSELHPDVLRCMDAAIPLPIVFELNAEGRIQVIAAYKRPSLAHGEADPKRQVISDYFATDWLPASSPRDALPVALNLGSLYEQILHNLMPLPARPQETLDALVERLSKAQAIRRELEKTVSRLEVEKQFKRKVEINAHLRQLKSEYEALCK